MANLHLACPVAFVIHNTTLHCIQKISTTRIKQIVSEELLRHTLRSWQHDILAFIMTLYPGLETNYTLE